MAADYEAREIIERLLAANHFLLRALPEEILRRIEQSPPADRQRDLTGSWRGMVNELEEKVEIRQEGSVVLLTGDATGGPPEREHTFTGEGRLVASVLVFSWSLQGASGVPQMGVNVMTLSPDGNTLEGKYFNALGGSGPERYERA